MSIQINDIVPYIQYVAGAGDTVFAVPFAFFAQTDLKVYSRAEGSTPDDASDILTIATDYTVLGSGDEDGGTVTLTAGATAGDVVTIVRDMPEQRLNLYAGGGDFTATAVNDDFSKDVMMNQQNEMICNTMTPTYNRSASVGAGDKTMDILGVGESWRKSADGTKLEAFTASSTTPVNVSTVSNVTVSVSQDAHGLSAGDIVRIDGAGDYIVSQANNPANSDVAGYVSAVADVNTFTLLMGGLITTGLSGLTIGDIYFLSPDNAGEITNVAPNTEGQVIKPLLQAASASTGVWLNYQGDVI